MKSTLYVEHGVVVTIRDFRQSRPFQPDLQVIEWEIVDVYAIPYVFPLDDYGTFTPMLFGLVVPSLC